MLGWNGKILIIFFSKEMLYQIFIIQLFYNVDVPSVNPNQLFDIYI